MHPPFELDVRPLLAGKRPPLPAIMSAVSGLQPGQALRLIAPFEPAPLYEVLAKRGFTHATHRRDDDVWEITFTPDA